jgi:hypothetical protein
MVLLLRKGIRVIHRTISPSEATPEEIAREMSGRDWDIIHIAGHCQAPEQDLAECGIRFASSAPGDFHRLTPLALEQLIRPKPPAFLFLNCCHQPPGNADAV